MLKIIFIIIINIVFILMIVKMMIILNIEEPELYNLILRRVKENIIIMIFMIEKKGI